MRLRIIVAAIAATALAIPAGAAAMHKDNPTAGHEDVTVMSRNVYLGANLDPAIGAPDIPTAIDGAGVIHNEIERTNFPERAVLLADEIKDAKADLVGLQEVALWRVQTPSDLGGPPINPGGTPATDVKYDFKQLLMDQLGSKYRVVVEQDEFEGELPADIDNDNSTGGPVSGEDLDLRLTMRDMIIARKGVKTKGSKSDNYDARFETNIGGVTVFADRGWVSTQAQVGNAKFRFVNTHLEAFGDPSIREAQAKELVKGPAKSKKDVVLVGDMNSAPSDPADERGAYDTIRKAGFVERQVKGNTSGHEEVLNDPNDQANFKRKIDFVFVNNKKIKLDKKMSAIVGRDDPSLRTPSGLWPSDHAGVESALLFP